MAWAPSSFAKRTLLLVGLLVGAVLPQCHAEELASHLADEQERQRPSGAGSLKAAVGDRYKIGVGVGHRVLDNPAEAELLRRHFSILTPENCMKPQQVHPAEDRWSFDGADRYVDFARANGLEVAGHCLVWAEDDRTAPWMMEDDGEPVSKAKLLQRIEQHVEMVVGRYADAVTMWDVVNEAIGDGKDGLLRDSVFSRTSGVDYIVTAFQTARANDPDALLIYNDYNGHKPAKRKKLLELLALLKENGAPVDAYGMQGHFELGDDSLPQLRETFDALRELGLKVVVSELDIDVVTRSRWWDDGGKHRDELADHDPYKDGLPTQVERQLIEEYVALFELFDDYSDIIERVSFWNLHDGQSWLNYFPWRRTNYPLLFDRNLQPKPVYDAVLESLAQRQAGGAE
ncbi:Endo-1,4-beta-xylanase B [Pseudobythopirellula maris]|uniref:Beta-xylanase n=1 Tax=Pseudobythopirellula maris TaxID=2527991 RepID=A0A5C5ZHQ3_9BACT|nr:endo-1,4-beta-xylanase [Pseudobythopirellula maris]TWT86949.1 Endo-1,4-beta-xylanase B [Pseudobythopirellula maris]